MPSTSSPVPDPALDPADGPATGLSAATHPLSVSYLVVGLVFLGLAGMWALRVADVIDTNQLGLMLPLILVGAGVVGLVAFTAKGVSRSRRAQARAAHDDPWAPWSDDEPTR
jgi:hypothetical protein